MAGKIPLISGFWSEAGLRRTAEYCDAWMPAGLDLDAAVGGLRAINNMAQSEFGRPPLELIYRVFCSPQLPGLAPVSAGPMQPDWCGSIEDLSRQVEQARAAGVSELILDTSFFADNPGPEGWLAQPEFFAPLAAVAHN